MTAEPDAEGTTVADLVAAAGEDQSGALWRLRDADRQLDANLVRLLPGAEVAAHTEADVDVLLLVVAGDGSLTLDGAVRAVGTGSLTFLPRGAARALLAGPQGLTFLTAHRRRAGLAIGRRPRSAGPRPECDVHLVCTRCHRHAIEADAQYCSRCGTPLKRRAAGT
ncbi:hypothetical protein ACFWUZ_30690 [Streptomyces sp. NPDC058646]|uniref:hypothetical protein n=1 Tax=Streptomyces sp. NPDC058646 TaxID=3346574 RepID=UPI003665CCDE